ncbi:cupin domain-containing protein [Cryobacterium soli]|uniref:cupin domain-containing protein n=1 Tax=Cryobacterium soli TaxID=2220095 RepID=UPI001FEAD65F|nr:cytoplasmic protein [Cryobacterium soli]
MNAADDHAQAHPLEAPEGAAVGRGADTPPRPRPAGAEPADPVTSNPEHYQVLFENDRVRVLEYRDDPGAKTTPHRHPDSVMVTLSDFSRRLSLGDRVFDTVLDAGEARWLPAQVHSGENTGASPTHAIFVELKGDPLADPTAPPPLGPS